MNPSTWSDKNLFNQIALNYKFRLSLNNFFSNLINSKFDLDDPYPNAPTPNKSNFDSKLQK